MSVACAEVSSDLGERRIHVTLSGEEGYLEHVIRGRRIVPGVVSLLLVGEVLRVCVKTKRPASQESSTHGAHPWVLKNIVWLTPVVLGAAALTLEIRLGKWAQQICHFEIRSVTERIIYCRGEALRELDHISESEMLEALTDDQVAYSLSAEQCYDWFAAAGVMYGLRNRALEKVSVFERRGERIARARLAVRSGTRTGACRADWVPSVLDGALQGSVGLLWDGNASPLRTIRSPVPFALEQMRRFRDIPEIAISEAWETKGEGKPHRLQVALYDLEGRICVRMSGLQSRFIGP